MEKSEYLGVIIPKTTESQATLCRLYIDAAFSLSPEFSGREIDPAYAENNFPYLLREFWESDNGWDYRIFVPFSGCKIAEDAQEVAMLRSTLGEPKSDEDIPVTAEVLSLLNWSGLPGERSCTQCQSWLNCEHYDPPCKDCNGVPGHPSFVQRPMIESY